MRDFSRNKTPGVLRGINLSDIHFIHRQTPTVNLISQLRYYITKEDPALLDVITFSGDVFDRITTFVTSDVVAVRAWGTWLLRYARKHDITLIFLEGTNLHDQKQSQWFVEQNEVMEIGAKVRYYDDLCMVDEDFGLKVLYLPDNYSHDPDVTLSAVNRLIDEKGSPDFILMHGAFEYQLPPEALKATCVHSSDAYNAMVEKTQGWIVSGHIHLQSQKGRIMVGGSFGRLAHGEEGPKGYLRYTLTESFNDQWEFVENKKADVYKTIKLHGLVGDEIVRVLERELAPLKKGDHIRIRCDKEDDAAKTFRSIPSLYPGFVWSIKTDAKNNQSLLKNSFVNNVIEKGGDLTKDNVKRLLVERICNKYPNVDALKVSAWLDTLP